MPFGLPEKTSLDYQKVFKSVVPLGQTDGLEKKRKTMEEAGHFNCVSWNLDAMEHIKHVELSRKCFSDYGSWSMTTSKRAKV